MDVERTANQSEECPTPVVDHGRVGRQGSRERGALVIETHWQRPGYLRRDAAGSATWVGHLTTACYDTVATSAVSGSSTLIWLAEVPFHGPPHRQQHLARLLGRDYEVLFVEPARPLRPPRLRIARDAGLRVAEIAPLLNAHPLRGPLRPPAMRWLAARLAWLQLRRAISAAGLQALPGASIVVCSNVFLIEAARALRPRLLVTDVCDDPRHFPGEPAWTAGLLRQAVRCADLVTTSSRSLEAEFRALGARRVAYLPNGIHAAFLDAASAQRPVRPSVPIVGFVGHLGPWVDLDLVHRTAAACPEYAVELIGSPAASMGAALDRVGRLPNVRHRPSIPYAAVPSALARFAVGMIPFHASAYTRAVNPIKLYEYAALDLPIVTTAFSPDVRQFEALVDVCATPEAFVRAVRERAAGRRAGSTRPIAEAHTWEHIATTFEALLGCARG